MVKTNWGEGACPVKRSLSRLEKNSIKSIDGLALIMPGGSCDEINELENIGFTTNQIFGFEKNDDVYQLAKTKYSSVINYGDIHESFKNIDAPISYLHLDYLGGMNWALPNNIIDISNQFQDNSRFRITFNQNARHGMRIHAWITKLIFYNLFVPICEKTNIDNNLLNNIKTKVNKHLFKDYNSEYSHFTRRSGYCGGFDDIAMAMILFITFNLQFPFFEKFENYTFSDFIYQNEFRNSPKLKCSLSNPKKYSYKDAKQGKGGSSSPMFTSWIDISHNKITFKESLLQICNYILQETVNYELCD